MTLTCNPFKENDIDLHLTSLQFFALLSKILSIFSPQLLHYSTSAFITLVEY